MRAVAGHFVSLFQLARPFLSVFRTTYEFFAHGDLGAQRDLPSEVAVELVIARRLMFLADADLTKPPSPVAFLSDPPMKGFAPNETQVAPAGVLALRRHRERNRFRVREKVIDGETEGFCGELAGPEATRDWFNCHLALLPNSKTGVPIGWCGCFRRCFTRRLCYSARGLVLGDRADVCSATARIIVQIRVRRPRSQPTAIAPLVARLGVLCCAAGVWAASLRSRPHLIRAICWSVAEIVLRAGRLPRENHAIFALGAALGRPRISVHVHARLSQSACAWHSTSLFAVWRLLTFAHLQPDGARRGNAYGR